MVEIRKGVGAWWRLEREWGHGGDSKGSGGMVEIRKGVGACWRLEREWGHGGD